MSAEVISRLRCVERIAYWSGQYEKARYTPTRDPALREKVIATCRERISAWRRRLASLDRLHGDAGRGTEGAA